MEITKGQIVTDLRAFALPPVLLETANHPLQLVPRIAGEPIGRNQNAGRRVFLMAARLTPRAPDDDITGIFSHRPTSIGRVQALLGCSSGPYSRFNLCLSRVRTR